MAVDYNICLGTAGWGVWHSPDAGKSWTRHRKPFPLNSRIQALAAHPTAPHTIYAAGDTGVFRSTDAGAKWERLGRQGDLPTVWSLAIDPVDPRVLFTGTRPTGVYRSRDGGVSWEKLAFEAAQECSIGQAFVTAVMVDPDDHRVVWAGVEIDGVWRSVDGGDTWKRMDNGLYDPDIHAMTIARATPKRVVASTNGEMFFSADAGESWTAVGVKQRWPLPYARGVAVKTDDPNVVFAGCGETTTGETGLVLRTRDFGATWETLTLPCRPNSTLWGLATHPADGNRIVAFTLFGEVFLTEDAGESWTKVAREFGEIRTAAWLPGRAA
jgi:photosystem II stability/assembly factor-like uncharacterized protein